MLRCALISNFILSLILNASPVLSQRELNERYRAAPTVWHREVSEPSPRQLLPLSGKWRAFTHEPDASYEVQVPGAYSFEGEVGFESTFRLDSTARRKTVRLHLDAANLTAQIELNGEIIASHQGGYTHFAVALNADNLRYDQENTLRITTSNRLAPLNTMPAKQRPLGWQNEGGLTRELFLEILPEIRFSNPRFHYELAGGAVDVSFEAGVWHHDEVSEDELAGLICRLEIWDSGRRQRLARSRLLRLAGQTTGPLNVLLECRLANPVLWSPDSPTLYSVRVILAQHRRVLDEIWQDLGFREVAIANQQLVLNGEPIEMRGINWIEDYGGNSALLDSAKMREVLSNLQRLGINALRVVGHPPHPLLPELCDRAGIFLLEEMPLYYLTEAHFVQPGFAELARYQAREMIDRDRYHPSVLAWGLGTASAPVSRPAQEAIRRLDAEMRDLDERPLYVVTNWAWQSLWIPHTDFMLLEWFQKSDFEQFQRLAQDSPAPVFPIVGCWLDGIAATAGGFQDHDNRHDAERVQAAHVGQVLEAIQKAPEVHGYFLRSLADWQGPMPLLAAGPLEREASAEPASDVLANELSTGGQVSVSRLHPAGIVDEQGKRRLAFQVVANHNHGKAGPVLVGKPPPERGSAVFQLAGIALVLVLLYFIQRDRRLQASLRRVFVHPHGFYVDLYENRKVAPLLTFLLSLAESGILALLLVEICYTFRESLVFDQILNLLLEDPATKATAIRLIWHPGWFVALLTAIFFVAGYLFAILLRLFGVFAGSTLPLSQYVAFVFWVGANLLVLAIFTPVFHRLLANPELQKPLLVLLVLVLLWTLIRFYRAIQVLYMIGPVRAMIFFGVALGATLSALAIYYDHSQALFEYLRYYRDLLSSAG